MTERSRSIFSVQLGLVPRLAQSPPQPLNSSPWSTAVRVTCCPSVNVHVQRAWQNLPLEPCTPAPPLGSNWLELIR